MQRTARWGSEVVEKEVTVTAAKCQEECQELLSCEYWSFELITKNCTKLSGPGDLAPGYLSNDTSVTSISGPKFCERSRSEFTPCSFFLAE